MPPKSIKGAVGMGSPVYMMPSFAPLGSGSDVNATRQPAKLGESYIVFHDSVFANGLPLAATTDAEATSAKGAFTSIKGAPLVLEMPLNCVWTVECLVSGVVQEGTGAGECYMATIKAVFRNTEGTVTRVAIDIDIVEDFDGGDGEATLAANSGGTGIELALTGEGTAEVEWRGSLRLVHEMFFTPDESGS